jgi:hypothetical protein
MKMSIQMKALGILVVALLLLAGFHQGRPQVVRALTLVPVYHCSVFVGFTGHGTGFFATSVNWHSLLFENRLSSTNVIDVQIAGDEANWSNPGNETDVFPNFPGGGEMQVTASQSGTAIYACA